jgi:endonuclease/exonuclease/phosphatase family metal-dependent hydrolase
VSLRVVSYNIKKGARGREAHVGAVLAELAPDVVVLQEATQPDVVEQLASVTGMSQWGARRGQSLAYLSRIPLSHAQWYQPRISRHAFLELVPVDAPWRLFGVHLSAVHAAWTERRRMFEMRALLAAVRAHQHGPHALVGDFNTVAPGDMLDPRKLPARLRALVWLSGGRVRWKTIQLMLDAGYVDAFRYRQPDVVGHTFPTWDPHARLDYAFVPAPFVERIAGCRIGITSHAKDASDHYPLVAELN